VGPARACGAVLITGACGGLGRAVVGALSARGAAVFAADISVEGLGDLARLPGVTAVPMDVTNQTSVAAAAARVRSSCTGLQGIICAAGVFGGGPLSVLSGEAVRRVFDVNFFGPFNVIREMFPLLRAGKGRVVLISSESTRVVMPFTGPYAASKLALEALADALRREAAPLGVRVSVFQPGSIRTPFLAAAEGALAAPADEQAYARPLALARRLLGKERVSGMHPQRAARLILRILAARRPRPRYRLGNDRLRALLSLLPRRWADFLISLVMNRASRL
jgi:NAD(P)-dependent dehydrogenase (short-subunit alcohol dehydrogenase family)